MSSEQSNPSIFPACERCGQRPKAGVAMIEWRAIDPFLGPAVIRVIGPHASGGSHVVPRAIPAGEKEELRALCWPECFTAAAADQLARVDRGLSERASARTAKAQEI